MDKPTSPVAPEQVVAMEVMDPKKLGEDVARWTGFEYTGYRTDNGQPEQRVNVSVERLGHAVAAVIAALPAATPAAPSAVGVALQTLASDAPTSEEGKWFTTWTCAQCGYSWDRTHDGKQEGYGPERHAPKCGYALARAALAQPAPVQAGAQQAVVDPMDWPLPCDVTVGHGTMRKGVSLRILVMRMKSLYEMATGNDADVVANRTPEERKALADKFLSAIHDKRPLHEQIAEVRRNERPSAELLNTVVGAAPTQAGATTAPVQQDAPAPSMVGDAKGGA